ncbi:hypothetical protein QYE76_071538 [Lolium multiflorum]|uniref:Protein kinase domain-containing protein n=1 Tax=Lolium multiflorum TaxID=4521 RepID=A0AAD8WEZ2_LOLMU|nr:hypothetical protein QYE76_071538 [Lolium multiflorum]
MLSCFLPLALASTYINTIAAPRSHLRTQPAHASLLLFLLQSLARLAGGEVRDAAERFPLLCCGCGGAGGVVATGVAARGAAHVDDGTAKNAAVNAGKHARQLSWAQVEAMTAGFTTAVVGEGGFSTVYLARLSGGSKPQLAAVKLHRSCSERLRRAFRQELDALLRVRHPHIVRLLAFCDQRDEGVLIARVRAQRQPARQPPRW